MSESKKSTFDHQLLFIAICLVAFGLVMNFSNGNSVRSIQQLKAVGFGIVGFCFVYIVPLHLYQKYAYHFLFITVISLLLVFGFHVFSYFSPVIYVFAPQKLKKSEHEKEQSNMFKTNVTWL